MYPIRTVAAVLSNRISDDVERKCIRWLATMIIMSMLTIVSPVKW